MLTEVPTQIKKLEDYKEFMPEGLFSEILKLAEKLKNKSVYMVNSTSRGGGVAELLEGLIPLLKGLDINARWYTIPGSEDFFKITKEIHNSLQGKNYELPLPHKEKYLNYIKKIYPLLKDMRPDIWVIHDPQPAGLIKFIPELHPSICHLHIDTTSANPKTWRFISEFLTGYDKIIVSSKKFVKKEIKKKTIVFAPAIDPLAVKNMPISIERAKKILESVKINPELPLIAQVSRFDVWKNPLGVIRAYQLAKKNNPGLQLALVGFFIADDDPEAKIIYKEVENQAKKDDKIFLFSDPRLLGDIGIDAFVNAVHTASDVILQDSLKEGFGLTCSEAMWKSKPVIAGTAAGLKTQIKNGYNGFLVSNSKKMAKKINFLLGNRQSAQKMGERARATVEEKFLITRFLRDYLEALGQIPGN